MNALTIYDWLDRAKTLDDNSFQQYVNQTVKSNKGLGESLFKLLIQNYNNQNFEYFAILLKIIGYLSPLNPQYLYMLAFYNDYNGDRQDDDWHDFDKARVFDPSNILILHTQAVIQQKQGNDAEAIHLYKKIRERISGNDEKKQEIIYQLHHLYYRNAIYHKAYFYGLKWQKNSNIDDADITHHINEIYARFGKFDKANIKAPAYYAPKKYWRQESLKSQHLYIRIEGSIAQHIIALSIISLMAKQHHITISLSMDYPWLKDYISNNNMPITYIKNHLQKLPQNIDFYGYFYDLIIYFYKSLNPIKTARKALLKTNKQQQKSMIASHCLWLNSDEDMPLDILIKPENINHDFIENITKYKAIISDDDDIIMLANAFKVPCFALCSGHDNLYILANHEYLAYFGQQQPLYRRLAFENHQQYQQRLSPKLHSFYKRYTHDKKNK